MEFIVQQEEIKRSLSDLSSIVSASSVSKDDISQNILLSVKNGVILLRATDYNNELSYTLFPKKVSDEATIAINASVFNEVIGKLGSGDIYFKYDEDRGYLILKSSTVSFDIRTRDATNFPSFEVEEIEKKVKIKQSLLRSLIEKSISCVSVEDFRNYLKGVRIEINGIDISVFTSDGHRMAACETKLEEPLDGVFGVCLTKKCAEKLLTVLSDKEDVVELLFSQNSVTVTNNGYQLKSKLHLCSYPNVRSLIPREYAYQINLNREDLLKAIPSVSILTQKRVKGITLSFSTGNLELRAENNEHEVAIANLPLEYQGDAFSVSLNADYLVDALRTFSSKSICFKFENQIVKAIIDSSEDESITQVKSLFIISRVIV